MHTILGANGIIGEELAKELKTVYNKEVRLVGRSPEKVNSDDQLIKANLLVPDDVNRALENTQIAYLTVGLPYKSDIWLSDWEKIMKNVIQGCKIHQCKLVYFDNTYAYPQNIEFQIEDTSFNPSGKKGQGKKLATEMLLTSIRKKEIEAVICRAPEFYGPGKTKGITNTLIFENLKKGKKPKVFLTDKVKRTLIYTPDASKSMALIANSKDTYGQTWHLPCDDKRLTYEEFIAEISQQLNRKIRYSILNSFVLKVGSFFNSNIKETQELLPRYAIDNIFDSSKFKNRFPDFKTTSYQDGIKEIIADYQL